MRFSRKMWEQLKAEGKRVCEVQSVSYWFSLCGGRMSFGVKAFKPPYLLILKDQWNRWLKFDHITGEKSFLPQNFTAVRYMYMYCVKIFLSRLFGGIIYNVGLGFI
jgi:hypothetical protein